MLLTRAVRSLSSRGLIATLALLPRLVAARSRLSARVFGSLWWDFVGLRDGRIDRLIRSGAFADGTVLTARFDGFGGRFGDVLNGWRVATALGARFRFHWPDRELTGIRDSRTVFAPEFVAAHLGTSADLQNARQVQTLHRRDLWWFHRGQGRILWFDSVGKRPFFEKFTVVTEEFSLPSMRTMGEAFAAIPLSPRLDRVRTWASSVAPFDVTIHVRRGDILDGDFRFGGAYANKAIPIPLIEMLLRDVADDARVLLVGNGLDEVRRRLGAPGSVVVPDDLECPGEGAPDVDDFKDFCLITRSRRLVAGRSVFALIPAHVAGIVPQPAADVLDRRSAVDVLLAFVRAHREKGSTDLEVALACEYLRSEHGEQLTAEELDELVDIARVADPTNPVYPLRRAAVHHRHGAGSEAHDVLVAAAGSGVPELCLRLLRHEFDLGIGVGLARIWGGFLSEEDRDSLRAAADHDDWAAFYAALDLAANGRLEVGRALLERIASTLPHDAVGEALDVFSRIASSAGPTAGGSLMAPTREELRATGDR